MLNEIVDTCINIALILCFCGFFGLLLMNIVDAIKEEIHNYKYGPLLHYYIYFKGDNWFRYFQAHNEDELIFSIQTWLNFRNEEFIVYEVPYEGCDDVSKWELVGEYGKAEVVEVSDNEEI